MVCVEGQDVTWGWEKKQNKTMQCQNNKVASLNVKGEQKEAEKFIKRQKEIK